MADGLDPHGQRLPIKLDSTSNGEFVPVPLDATLRRANQLALEQADHFARRLGMGRQSRCGVGAALGGAYFRRFPDDFAFKASSMRARIASGRLEPGSAD